MGRTVPGHVLSRMVMDEYLKLVKRRDRGGLVEVVGLNYLNGLNMYLRFFLGGHHKYKCIYIYLYIQKYNYYYLHIYAYMIHRYNMLIMILLNGCRDDRVISPNVSWS